MTKLETIIQITKLIFGLYFAIMLFRLYEVINALPKGGIGQ